MKLVYKDSKEEVKIGDKVLTETLNKYATVTYFTKPHKAASAGFVTLKENNSDLSREFYVGVIGAEWIEREDRE